MNGETSNNADQGNIKTMPNTAHETKMSNTPPVSIHVMAFDAHPDLMQTLWGQILKDHEAYTPAEASRFIHLLGRLGYKMSYGFMLDEYRHLLQVSNQTGGAKIDKLKPDHYMAYIAGGLGGVYVSADMDKAYKAARLDAMAEGYSGLSTFRVATEDEVAWHIAMSGTLNLVDPLPLDPLPLDPEIKSVKKYSVE